MFSFQITYELFLRLLTALVLGAIVGFEREARRRPAGLRTHMLVSLGACLFTIISISNFGMFPPYIIAGIVTGIGFLGAGSIIGSGQRVEGITTAATLWVVAGVGLAAGVGEYVLAAMAALLVLIVLLIKGADKELQKGIKGIRRRR